MPSTEKEPIYDVYCISRHQYQRFLNILFGDSSVAQLVALMSRVVLGGVAEVVGSNLARGKIFTASISSVDSLYPSVLIYCLNLHQFLILCSLKAMMFVKLNFRTSDIYLISLVSMDPSGISLANEIDAIHRKRTNIRRVLHQSSSISGGCLNILFGDGSVAQLVALMSGVVLGGVAEVVGSNLARGKIFTASISFCIYIYEPRHAIMCR